MPGVTDSHADDKKVLTATFPTQGGANLAVKKLQDLEKQGLLDVDNTITVNKNAWDKIDVHETTGGSGRKDAGIGALVGGVLGVIFPTLDPGHDRPWCGARRHDRGLARIEFR